MEIVIDVSALLLKTSHWILNLTSFNLWAEDSGGFQGFAFRVHLIPWLLVFETECGF